jgi:hypothetical protein
MTDTNFFDEREHFLRYHEIYHIFQNEEYPSDNEDIDEYQIIGRSGIHTLASRRCSSLYNDIAQWCFTHL